MTPAQALQSFTSDLFPELLPELVAAIDSPPRTTEEVGFYLRGDESDFELSFRTAVSKFETRDNVWSFEDKYVHEMVSTWVESGVLPKKLPEVVSRVLNPYSENSIFADYEKDGDEKHLASLRELYPSAVAAIEKIFADRNQALLSFELGGGDTIYFVIVDAASAEKWRDVEFLEEPLLGTRSADWAKFWDFYCYATAIPMSVGSPNLVQPPLKSRF